MRVAYINWYRWCCALLLVSVKSGGGHRVVAPSSDYMRTLHSIMSTEGWDLRFDRTNFTDQKIFVGGKTRSLRAVLTEPTLLVETDVRAATGAMYTALGCMCAETINKALGAVLSRLSYNEGATVTGALADVNRTALKAVSTLICLADAAPSARSSESGVLKALLALNVNVNRLLATENRPSRSEPDAIRRAIFQTVNLLERFAIPNCAPMTLETAAVPVVRPPAEFAEPGIEEKTDELITTLDGLLNKSGLLGVDFYKYNIGYVVESVAGRGAPSAGEFKFNIIERVLRQFCSIMNIPRYFDKNNDIVDIFDNQKSALNLILLIINESTMVYLKRVKLQNGVPVIQSKKQKKSSLKLIRDYEILLNRSIVAKFPLDFANRIRSILGVLKDVLRFKTVRGVDVLIKRGQNAKTLLSADCNIVPSALNNILSSEDFVPNTADDLHEFIEKIVSVDDVKYYNEIFSVLQNDSGEPDEKRERHLNEIRYVTSKQLAGNKDVCKSASSVYAYCYETELIVHSEPKAKKKTIMAQFVNISNALNAMITANARPNTPDDYVVRIADQYLEYNAVNYPDDGDVRDKLTRALYLITNFVDRYEALNCEYLTNRDSIYVKFRNFPASPKDHYITIVPKKRLKIFKVTPKLAEKNIKTEWESCVLFKRFVGGLIPVQPLRLYWKGELKAIDGIADDLTNNVSDFFAISAYVRVVVEWTIAILSHTILDVMDDLLTGNVKKDDFDKVARLFKNDLGSIKRWPKRSAIALKTVIDEIGALKTIDDVVQFQMIRMQAMLEEDLEQYGVEIQEKTIHKNKTSVHVKELSTISDKLTETLSDQDGKDAVKCTDSPLLFQLSDYFNR